jgi:hypothetical protein
LEKQLTNDKDKEQAKAFVALVETKLKAALVRLRRIYKISIKNIHLWHILVIFHVVRTTECQSNYIQILLWTYSYSRQHDCLLQNAKRNRSEFVNQS